MMSSPVPSLDVMVVGEVYVDHVMSGFDRWPSPGEEVVTEAYTREIGGGAATTACGLGRLGRRVGLLGLVGEIDAPWFAQRLQAFGVDHAELQVRPGATGTTLSVSTREDRSFFTHLGVNRELDAELLREEILGAIAGAAHVHFAMPLTLNAAFALAPPLKARGRTISLDMGYQPDWLADRANLEIMRAVDHLMPNEKEAALLCGDASSRGYLDFARRNGLSAGMVKLGARGAAAWDGETICEVRPPAVDALDPTGAGDAFNAGFIDGLLDKVDVRERLQRACICGALSTRAAGALGGLPDRIEMRSAHERTYGT